MSGGDVWPFKRVSKRVDALRPPDMLTVILKPGPAGELAPRPGEACTHE